MQVGDLVLLKRSSRTVTQTRDEIAAGPALVLEVGYGIAGLKILTRNQIQVWVSPIEVEVINERR